MVTAAAMPAAHYAQVDALSVERNSQRSTARVTGSIARVTGVARMPIAKRLNKAAAASPPLPRRPKKA